MFPSYAVGYCLHTHTPPALCHPRTHNFTLLACIVLFAHHHVDILAPIDDSFENYDPDAVLSLKFYDKGNTV